MLLGTVILWPPIAAIVDLMLWIFTDLRTLTLEQIRNSWRGLFHFLQNVGLDGVAAVVRFRGRRGSSTYWWASFPIIVFFAVVVRRLGQPRALATRARCACAVAFGEPTTEAALPADRGRPPEPLPLALHDVSYRYPNADSRRVERRITHAVAARARGDRRAERFREVDAGAHRRRTARTDERTHRTARRRSGSGGVAGPRSCSNDPKRKCSGVRVADDVVWGLDDPTAVDIPASLAARRPAPTSPIARRRRCPAVSCNGSRSRPRSPARPQLLVSDESTAMVDNDGRGQVVALAAKSSRATALRCRARHALCERSRARRSRDHARSRTGRGRHGRTSRSTRPTSEPHTPGPTRACRSSRSRTSGTCTRAGTPWAHRALEGIDLAIHERESVLVVGHNGSGKSTLAWIIAGLVVPERGQRAADRAGRSVRPLAASIGRVGLSFQHARLAAAAPDRRQRSPGRRR